LFEFEIMQDDHSVMPGRGKGRDAATNQTNRFERLEKQTE
jgi:hypothetical protein